MAPLGENPADIAQCALANPLDLELPASEGQARSSVAMLEGGHVAHLTVGASAFPYIPQWIVIFMLMLMFAVDFYQNLIERKREQDPVHLHRRKP